VYVPGVRYSVMVEDAATVDSSGPMNRTDPDAPEGMVTLTVTLATVSSATLTASGSLPTSTVRALEALYMLELSPETF